MVCSNTNVTKIVHGLSIPVGKLGWYLPRTLSTALSDKSDQPAFQVNEPATSSQVLGEETGSSGQLPTSTSRVPLPQPLYRIGGSIIRARESRDRSKSRTPQMRTPRQSSPVRDPATTTSSSAENVEDQITTPTGPESRTIRFTDERQNAGTSTQKEAETSPVDKAN